ncbi:putative Peptidase T [Blattamonas nauphoetae]|uniref:Peptidase T n=1 Tax=Blattamonas nauphoetae TaxID=2049346 RepID=A0ABQ9XW92_9EUKA|nr:putative Peptidase T [Blattamonas nauphoetae]
MSFLSPPQYSPTTLDPQFSTSAPHTHLSPHSTKESSHPGPSPTFRTSFQPSENRHHAPTSSQHKNIQSHSKFTTSYSHPVGKNDEHNLPPVLTTSPLLNHPSTTPNLIVHTNHNSYSSHNIHYEPSKAGIALSTHTDHGISANTIKVTSKSFVPRWKVQEQQASLQQNSTNSLTISNSNALSTNSNHPQPYLPIHPPNMNPLPLPPPTSSILISNPLSNRPSTGLTFSTMHLILDRIRQEAIFSVQRSHGKGGGQGSHSSVPTFPPAGESSIPLNATYGHIVSISQDQIGSRFLQSRLSEATVDEVSHIFAELIDKKSNPIHLMTHCFANYVVQKICELCSDELFQQLLVLLRSHFYTLSFDTFGCRVLQSAIPRMGQEKCTLLTAELYHNCIKAIHHQNANHVLQKSILYASSQANHNLITSLEQHGISSIATHTYGCRVIQRLLETDDRSIHVRLATILFPSFQSLVLDQYGNFVIQHLVQNSDGEIITVSVPTMPGRKETQEVKMGINESVIRSLRGNFFILSKHKFGSNVVEKCLEYSSDSLRRYIVKEIMGSDPSFSQTHNFHQPTLDTILHPSCDELVYSSIPDTPPLFTNPSRPFSTHPLLCLLMDQFGNYVAQRICDVASLDVKERILNQILTVIPPNTLRGRRDLLPRKAQLVEGLDGFSGLSDDQIQQPPQEFIIVRVEKLIRALEREENVKFPEPPRQKLKKERDSAKMAQKMEKTNQEAEISAIHLASQPIEQNRLNENQQQELNPHASLEALVSTDFDFPDPTSVPPLLPPSTLDPSPNNRSSLDFSPVQKPTPTSSMYSSLTPSPPALRHDHSHSMNRRTMDPSPVLSSVSTTPSPSPHFSPRRSISLSSETDNSDSDDNNENDGPAPRHSIVAPPPNSTRPKHHFGRSFLTDVSGLEDSGLVFDLYSEGDHLGDEEDDLISESSHFAPHSSHFAHTSMSSFSFSPSYNSLQPTTHSASFGVFHPGHHNRSVPAHLVIPPSNPTTIPSEPKLTFIESVMPSLGKGLMSVGEIDEMKMTDVRKEKQNGHDFRVQTRRHDTSFPLFLKRQTDHSASLPDFSFSNEESSGLPEQIGMMNLDENLDMFSAPSLSLSSSSLPHSSSDNSFAVSSSLLPSNSPMLPFEMTSHYSDESLNPSLDRVLLSFPPEQSLPEASQHPQSYSFTGLPELSPFGSESDKSEIVDRFIRYCRIDTQSDGSVEKCPSTEKQFDIAKLLASELEQLGIKAEIDTHCFVYATLEGNAPSEAALGLLAHMDVSPDAPSSNISPTIRKNITGEDIVLCDDIVIAGSQLEFYKGQDIITTDGKTLLGADDKAGIAAIMQALTVLVREGDKIKHPTLKICFTPDEEIGAGISHIDLTKFNPKYAYTIDAGRVGEIECETFNAMACTVKFVGVEVHPGSAFDILVSAIRLASEFVEQLPKDQAPETTRGREGYFHPTNISGGTGEASVKLILRDFDEDGLAKREQFVRDLVEAMQKKHPKAKITAIFRHQYKNMFIGLKDLPELVDRPVEAAKRLGVIPIQHPIRGGTDGARLTFMGIPTPNLFGGGENFHSKREFLPIPSLIKSAELILNMLPSFTQ